MTAAPAQGGVDTKALNDIATNGAILNQAVSDLIKSVDGLGGIVLPVANGGTGLTAATPGALAYGTPSGTIGYLPDVAVGSVLLSAGVGATPSWGLINIATLVSGILSVVNGGTGRALSTAFALICGGTTSTGAQQSVATGTAGLPLLSGGAAALPAFGAITITSDHALFIQVAQNQDIIAQLNVSGSWTILQVTTICTGGTCTLVTKKNTTAITGLSNAVSTTQVVTTATAGNVLAVGDNLRITVSANASAVNVAVSIKYSRTIP